MPLRAVRKWFKKAHKKYENVEEADRQRALVKERAKKRAGTRSGKSGRRVGDIDKERTSHSKRTLDTWR